MNDHPLSEHLTVWLAVAVGALTSEKLLIFLGVCFTVLRIYVTWRNRNDQRGRRG